MKDTTKVIDINGKSYSIAMIENIGDNSYSYTFPKRLFNSRKRVYGKSLEELKEKILLQEAELRRQLTYQRPESNLLSDFMEYYFKFELIHRSPRDLQGAIELFRNAVKGSEIDKDVATLTSDDITRFFKRIVYLYHLEKILLIYNHLEKALNFAACEYGISVNLEDVALPEKDTLCISNYIPTPEDLDALVDALNGGSKNYYSPIKYVVEFMVMTGIRSNMLLFVKPEDFNLEEKTLFLRYGGKERYFALKDEWIDWLKDVEEKGGIRITRYTNSPDETAFFNEKGTKISTTNVKNFIDGVLMKNGLPDGITSASIHKGVIVKLYNEGVSAQELKKRYFLRTLQQVEDFKNEFLTQRLLFGESKQQEE